MMKRVHAYSAPRGGAGFGLTGRPVPYPFLFWISDGDRFCAEVMCNVQICVLRPVPNAPQTRVMGSARHRLW